MKISGSNSNNLRYTDDTTLVEENEDELKNLLMRVKEEREQAGLKLKKTKIMASDPITSWQIGEKQKQWQVLSSGSKIIGDSDCSHEIKTLDAWNKTHDKSRQRIKKAKTHHFVDKCPYSQSYGFSSSHVQMQELDHKNG